MRLAAAVCLIALSLAACQKAEKPGPTLAQNAAAAEAFMAKNKTAPGVQTTASGLQYKVLSSGPATGAHPKPTDEVKVMYEGRLVDGTVFDSSYRDGSPIIFTLNRVIPGWTEVLQLMRPGDVWEVYIPPKLGYGEQDQGTIPPNSALIFKIELLDLRQLP